jgi:hypothetical protein
VVPSLLADVRVEVTAEQDVALTQAADAVAEASESESLASVNGAAAEGNGSRPSGDDQPPDDAGPESGSSPVEANR